MSMVSMASWPAGSSLAAATRGVAVPPPSIARTPSASSDGPRVLLPPEFRRPAGLSHDCFPPLTGAGRVIARRLFNHYSSARHCRRSHASSAERRFAHRWFVPGQCVGVSSGAHARPSGLQVAAASRRSAGESEPCARAAARRPPLDLRERSGSGPTVGDTRHGVGERVAAMGVDGGAGGGRVLGRRLAVGGVRANRCTGRAVDINDLPRYVVVGR